jgi:hypothetical protein
MDMKRRTLLKATQGICVASFLSSANASVKASCYNPWLVVAIGGAGCNIVQALSNMQPLGNGRFLFIDSDYGKLSDVASQRNPKTVQPHEWMLLGHSGLGTGGSVNEGARLADELTSRLENYFRREEMVYIIVGLGGGLGSALATVLARSVNITSSAYPVATAVLPFDFEGMGRLSTAQTALYRLHTELPTKYDVDVYKNAVRNPKETVTDYMERENRWHAEYFYDLFSIGQETRSWRADEHSH